MTTYVIIENILNNNYEYLNNYEERIKNSITMRPDKKEGMKQKTILKVFFGDVKYIIFIRNKELVMLKEKEKLKILKIEREDNVFLREKNKEDSFDRVSLKQLIIEYKKNSSKSTSKKRKRQTRIDEPKIDEPEQKKAKYNSKEEIELIKRTLTKFEERIISLEDENKKQKEIIDNQNKQLSDLNKRDSDLKINNNQNFLNEIANNNSGIFIDNTQQNPTDIKDLDGIDWENIIEDQFTYINKEQFDKEMKKIYNLLQTHEGKINQLNTGLKETNELQRLVTSMYQINKSNVNKFENIEKNILLQAELIMDSKITKSLNNNLPVTVKETIKNNINDILNILNPINLRNLSINNNNNTNNVDEQFNYQQMVPLYNNNSSSAPDIQTSKQTMNNDEFIFDFNNTNAINQLIQEESLY